MPGDEDGLLCQYPFDTKKYNNMTYVSQDIEYLAIFPCIQNYGYYHNQVIINAVIISKIIFRRFKKKIIIFYVESFIHIYIYIHKKIGYHVWNGYRQVVKNWHWMISATHETVSFADVLEYILEIWCYEKLMNYLCYVQIWIVIFDFKLSLHW